jgi:dihydrofolate reductase
MRRCSSANSVITATACWDEQLERAMGESMSKPFDLVLGRKTYEIFAAHWPHTDDPGAEPLNKATKHVASTTLTEPDWENSKLIEGEVPEGIRALKQQEGPELQVHGSANLIQTLLEHGLIDEFRLCVFPLVLGTGKRLFDGGGARGPGARKLAGALQRSDPGELPKRRRDQIRLLRLKRPARRSRRAAPRTSAERRPQRRSRQRRANGGQCAGSAALPPRPRSSSAPSRVRAATEAASPEPAR